MIDKTPTLFSGRETKNNKKENNLLVLSHDWFSLAQHPSMHLHVTGLDTTFPFFPQQIEQDSRVPLI